MKHIKKKFLFEFNEENVPPAQFGFNVKDIDNIKIAKDQSIIVKYSSGKFVTAFQHNHHGKKIIIPEPDPILIYFNNAYLNYRQIFPAKDTLFGVLSGPIGEISEDVVQKLYAFFGLSMGFAINLFTSMEAYINRLIPKDYQYFDTKNNRTEVYNKEQIQRHLSFDVKMKEVVPHAKSLEFKSAMQLQHIQNLKDYRDLVVHMKEQKEGLNYEYIFKRAINFKYEESLHSVRDYMNFYTNNYIIECDCGRDF